MKRRLCLVLFLLMLVTCVTASGEAADWNYDANYGILRGYNGAGGDVVVPGELDGFTVDVIGVSVFRGETITSLTLPETVLELRSNAISTDRFRRNHGRQKPDPPRSGIRSQNPVRPSHRARIPFGLRILEGLRNALPGTGHHLSLAGDVVPCTRLRRGEIYGRIRSNRRKHRKTHRYDQMPAARCCRQRVHHGHRQTQTQQRIHLKRDNHEKT